MENPSVADLVDSLHSNIDSIHQCVQSLSDTNSHDAEMEKLEMEREARIKQLASKHETEVQHLTEQRRIAEEEFAERRRQEEEEIIKRRRREDEERKARFEKEEQERIRLKMKEDERREAELENEKRSVSEDVEAELEKLEDEMERRVEEGKKMLAELDEKRKVINKQIETALNTPTVVPKINFRSRARTRGKSVIENKSFGEENGVLQDKDRNIDVQMGPEKTNGAQTQVNNGNGHTEEISATIMEDENPAQVEEPISSTRGPQQVSEGAPPEEEHTEANLANSEKKDSAEALTASEDVVPTTIDDHVQGDKIAPSSSMEVSKSMEVPEKITTPASVPSFSNETRTLPDEPTSDDTNLESDTATPTNSSAEEKEVHMFSNANAEPTSQDVPRNENPSDPVEENPPAHDTSFTKQPPSSEERNENSEEPIINATDTPVEHAVSRDSRPEDPVVETELSRREAPSNIEEPEAKESNTPYSIAETTPTQVEATSKIDEPVVEILSAPIESQAESEEAPIMDESPAPLGSSYEQKGHEVEGVEHFPEDYDAPVDARLTDPVPQGIERKPTVFEDPKDVKAREEIAKPNAEFMKVAMEEEATDHNVADAGSSEVIPGNEHIINVPEIAANQGETSNGESSEPVGEGSLDPVYANSTDHRTGNPSNSSHDVGTTLDESPEQATGDEHIETSMSGLDSAIDVQTPRQFVVENPRNGHSSEHKYNKHEQPDLLTSEVAPDTTSPLSLGEPGLSPQMDLGNTEGVGHEETFDHAFELRDFDAAVEESASSTPLTSSEGANDWRNDSPATEVQSKSSHDNSAAPLAEEPEINHHVLNNEDDPLREHEEIYDDMQNEEVLGNPHEEPSNHSPGPRAPSRPRSGTLSGTDMVNEAREFTRAESPVTVLNSDDLFEDDDDDEDQVEETSGHENSLSHYDDNREEYEEQDLPDIPIKIDTPASNETSEPARPQNIPEYEHTLPLNKQYRISQEIHRTNSGRFASLVDAIRSDVPTASHLADKEEVREIGMPGDGHLSDEILDEYHQTKEPENNHLALGSWLEDEEDVPPSSTPLHIRTHTADTIPSFETYAQSDDSTPSTPDTVISPPRQVMHEEPTIRESWMQQGEEMEHHGLTEELKSVASPLQQSEFDPFISQTYPSFASPKPSLANLHNHDEDSFEDYNSSPESVDIEREACHSPGPLSQITANSLQNPSHVIPSELPRLYDSPISQAAAPRSPNHSSFLPPSSLANPAKTPPSIPSNSVFQKTRSLFESSSRQETQSTPPLGRPRSLLYNTPSPASRLKSRPSSLYMRSPFNLNKEPRYHEAPTEPEDELMVPRSLDRNGKPPSPAFILPSERGMMGRGGELGEEELKVRERRGSSFLGGIGRLGELVGLEGSIHNPDREQGKPLLGDEENGH